MKFVRPLLIVLGVIVVLGGLAIALALTPAVQRWAVLRATRDVPGLKLEVDEISAGFSAATLRQVTVEKQQVVVKVERVEAAYSLTAFLIGRNLVIRRLAVAGLEVDASRVARGKAEAAAAGAPAAAPGVLARVELPVDLTLDDVRIEGRALLPGAPAEPPLTAEYTITGGGIAPGREGELQLDAKLRNPAPAATVTALHARASLHATLTPQRNFNKVTLATTIDAEGLARSGQSQLKVAAELYRSSGGENYEVSVDTLGGPVAENMLKLHAELPAGSQQYRGNWELKARAPQLAPFALGTKLPDFDVRGSGRFAVDPAAQTFSLQGGLQGEASRLEAIEPAWRAFGTVRTDASFDVAQQGGILQLNQFKVLVSGAKPVLEAQLTAPVKYDARRNQILAADSASEQIMRISLPGVPLDWVRPFVAAADVSGSAITGQVDLMRASGQGAAVRGRLELGELNVVQDGRPLLLQAKLAVQAEATLADGAIEAPVLNLKLSTATGDVLDLAGKLSTRLDANAPVTAQGRFNATSTKLLALWLPGAPVIAQGELGLTLRGKQIDFQPGRLQVSHAGKPLVSATILQPFTADTSLLTVVPRDAAAPVARIELGKLPLGLLPLTDPDAKLSGVVQQGIFEMTGDGPRLSFRATAPLRLAEVGLTQGRQPALTGLSIEALPAVQYGGPAGFSAETGDVVVRTAQGPFINLRAQTTRAPGQDLQATANFTVEIPALATQPIFAEARAVSAGKASGEVRAVVSGHRQLEARLTLNGLVAAEGGQILPVANLGFRSVVQPSGAVSIQAPVLLDNAGRRSDLNFALELLPLGRGYSVDGKLTGQQVELEDVLGVLGVFSASAASDAGEKSPAAAAPVAPDTTAAWSRLSGQLLLDVKSISRGKEWAMTGLTGNVAIEPTRLAVTKLGTAFGETSRLAAKMELRFTGGAMPYRLTGDYSLNEFDVGKLFRAIDASKPPTVEGLFSIAGKLSGNGETPGRALDRAQGEFQLTSRQGIFRGLQRTSEKVSMATKAVELASSLGSLFGSDKTTKVAEKVAGTAYYVDQLVQGLAELKFDLLSVKLSRDEMLNMNLEDISLVSPELRLNGRGEVSYVEGKSLLEQPLTASLDVAVRGKIETQFDKLNLVNGVRDDLGYAKARDTVKLGGTLGRPNANAWFARMTTEKLSDFLSPQN